MAWQLYFARRWRDTPWRPASPTTRLRGRRVLLFFAIGRAIGSIFALIGFAASACSLAMLANIQQS